MSLAKKDLIALADELRGAEVLSNADTIELSEDLLQRLCCFLRWQNPNFKEERWREYLAGKCAPNGGER